MVGFALPSVTPAQNAPALSLADARLAARQASPELRAAREGITAAEARARQGAAFLNPRFAYAREQTSGSGLTNAQNLFLLEQPIEIGGARTVRRDAARLRRDAAQARLAAAEAQLDYEVTRAYALAVAADRKAALAEQASVGFTQALRVSGQRRAAGDISGYADRRLRLEAARYGTLRAEALLDRRTARLTLASLLHDRPDTVPVDGLVLSDSVPAPALLLRRDSLLAQALRNRADIRAAELEAEASLADGRLASRERWSTAILSGGLKNERVNGVTLQGFAAGLTLPLPLWDRRGGAIDAATADARRLDATVEATRRDVAREVALALDGYRVAQEQVELLAPQLGAESQSALRAAQVAYAEGEIPLVELLDAVRAYREAEASFASLRAEITIRFAALERAAGFPLVAPTSRPGGTDQGAPRRQP